MKKNLGVSMITLVITIIVIIILAAIAFSSATGTIENSNFANFTNNIAEVENLLREKVVILKSEEVKDGRPRTDAQLYNYVAKGATVVDESGINWLPRNYAELMHCTQLSGDRMKEVIDYKLPVIKTSTSRLNSVRCSYFVTKTGTVFVWPPYIYKNELWVNGDTKLMDENGNAFAPESGEVYTTYEEKDTKTFKFKVDNVEILVCGENRIITGDTAFGEYFTKDKYDINGEKYHIHFMDGYKSQKLGGYLSPLGVESMYLYGTESQGKETAHDF